ncbi:hypothetical protein Xcel_0494 [Xylanimonas cellulosilytica DSM 15894]|uniref:WXG100 family type VII secretion target n=1 Tax=Xylanimonas cellulosilytica (strain DSM 15894 / JCM 12276 / CECT 5975 / KCTC 9989 / LMG 20990 / NBRC 107835 / XIL07) TaxID=446471 RepID=D1BW30_XYLCX|nr:hypothetical protein [Xylanimonas cellulosilytica]ACZ29533.1 hypothetical protein Xcel_0494 [Xylanimonas cellulosilytica DSM 15894]
MAAGYLGLKPEDMQELIGVLNTKAGKINDIISRLSKEVRGTTWDGPDAERFKNDWDSNLSVKLRNVQRSLEEIAKSAKSELNQQTTTSR